MISLPDAFKKFKSRMELNEREQQNASKRQKCESACKNDPLGWVMSE